MPPDHTQLAACSICFCPFLGCFALWHSSQVRTSWRARSYDRARSHSLMVGIFPIFVMNIYRTCFSGVCVCTMVVEPRLMTSLHGLHVGSEAGAERCVLRLSIHHPLFSAVLAQEPARVTLLQKTELNTGSILAKPISVMNILYLAVTGSRKQYGR